MNPDADNTNADAGEPAVFGKDQPRTLFLLRHRFKKSPEQFVEAYAGHRTYIDENIRSGRFITAGPVVPWDGGIILAVGSDRGAIERVIARDPLVDAEITEYEITEWKTTIRSEAFGALLAELAANQ